MDFKVSLHPTSKYYFIEVGHVFLIMFDFVHPMPFDLYTVKYPSFLELKIPESSPDQDGTNTWAAIVQSEAFQLTEPQD